MDLHKVFSMDGSDRIVLRDHLLGFTTFYGGVSRSEVISFMYFPSKLKYPCYHQFCMGIHS